MRTQLKRAQPTQSDGELWRRLEELEIEEAMENQWEADGEEEDSDDEDDDDDDDLSSNESEITESESDGEPASDTGLSVTNLGLNEAKTIKRRVSWGNLVDPPSLATEPLRTIKFQHSACDEPQEVKHFDENSVPETPADLVHFSCRKPKSILKASDSEILIREEEDKTIRPVSPRQIKAIDCEPAVQENIVERNISDQSDLCEEPGRKVSKFKAARLKSKQSD